MTPRDPSQNNSASRVAPGAWLAFVIFLAVITVSSCGKRTPSSTTPDAFSSAIQAVMAQDRAAGDRFRRDVKTDRLTAARSYTQALADIALRPCPPDFQEAFLKHRYAWRELVPYLEKYSGFTGDLLVLFEIGSAVVKSGSVTTQGDQELDRIRREISRTYYEVERVALRYGVQGNQK